MKLRVRKGSKGFSYYITLPKQVVRALNWRPGTELEVMIESRNGKTVLVLVPKT